MNIDVFYGEDIVNSHLGQIGDFVVITDSVPWRLYSGDLSVKPIDVIMPNTLEKLELDRIVSTIPSNVEIVGLGGGAVIDAAKYLAYLRNSTPMLIPTITSSNAHFSDFISIRRKGTAFGFKKMGWPKTIIVDYTLIAQANPRWNRAGYGDLLFLQTALNDWRIASHSGMAPPIEPVLEQKLEVMIKDAVELAERIWEGSKEGLDGLMRLSERVNSFIMDNISFPLSAGSEHLFAWNFEQVTGRHLIHGEMVALGIIIASYLQDGNHHELRAALDRARVVYHPKQLEISWNEIKQTLLTIQEYNKKFRHFYTIFNQVQWTPVNLHDIKQLFYH
jgi:glycerol-1-phosphate dehydrogenase [NAD(P)+]